MKTTKMNSLTIVLVFLRISFVCSQEVDTAYGKIKGEERKNQDGTSLYVFLGIPYAVQPVGELKFKDPILLSESFPNKYFTANKETKCKQFSEFKRAVIGQEDCLNLNIYTTSLDKNANHDVIVLIHGGAFMIGYGNAQTPEYIFDKNKSIVFVSLNYRLGPFGFLSSENSVVPGNMGLKDQVVALKWIKKNIKGFGGNPENIVISGGSAGGISVHLHYFSPMTKGLFTKGISFSGDALSSGVKTKNVREGFDILVKLFEDCQKAKDDSEAVKCLSKVSSDEILQKLLSQKTPYDNYMLMHYYRPVVEKGSAKPFLEDHPFHLLKKGKINNAPWLVSIASAEGLFEALKYISNPQRMDFLDKNWNNIAPYLLSYKEFVEEDSLPRISELVRKHYFGDGAISSENQKGLIKVFGERIHLNSVENSVRLHAAASKANTYIYMFNYEGTQSISTISNNVQTFPKNLGASHTDDLIYIFKMKFFKLQDQDLLVQKILLNVLSSFIKNGIPDTGTGVKWPPVSRKVTYVGNIDYLQIDQTPQVMSKPEISGRAFWDSLLLDELRLSGKLYIPKYIQDLKKKPRGLVALLRWFEYHTRFLWKYFF